jgi:hypothetical protein
MAAMSLLAASVQRMGDVLLFNPIVHVNVFFSPNHMDTLISL